MNFKKLAIVLVIIIFVMGSSLNLAALGPQDKVQGLDCVSRK